MNKNAIIALFGALCLIFACKSTKHVTEKTEFSSLDSTGTYELREVADTLITLPADTSLAVIPFAALDDSAEVVIKNGDTQITLKREGAQLTVKAIRAEKLVPVKIDRTIKSSGAVKKAEAKTDYQKDKETYSIPWWYYLIGAILLLIGLAYLAVRAYLKGWFGFLF